MIFDTHAHYDDHLYDEDRDAVLRSLADAGVSAVVNAGSGVESLDAIRALTRDWPFVYGAAGLHPDEAGKMTPEILGKMEELLADPKFVAVGETGLDYHWDVEPHDVQIRCFKEQVRLAHRTGKPVIIHSRTAALDTMTVIQEMYGKDGELGRDGSGDPEFRGRPAGVLHSYSGSLEQAKIYISLGFYLGIGGVVTYQTSKKLKKVVAGIPLDCLVLETDCPYLTPEPHRGVRNSSAMLTHVVRKIAEIKEVSPETVEDVTWRNACRLFGLLEEKI